MFVDLKLGDTVGTVVDRYFDFKCADIREICIKRLRAVVDSWGEDKEQSNMQKAEPLKKTTMAKGNKKLSKKELEKIDQLAWMAYVDLRCGDDVETVVDRYLTFVNEDMRQQAIAQMRAEVESWKKNKKKSTSND